MIELQFQYLNYSVVYYLSPLKIKIKISKYLQCVKWQDNQNSIYRSIQFTYLAFRLHQVNTNIYFCDFTNFVDTVKQGHKSL
jgi:hypothetical protein